MKSPLYLEVVSNLTKIHKQLAQRPKKGEDIIYDLVFVEFS